VEQITAGLKENLKSTLPRYAIPSYFIPLANVPTTVTGKRDRRQLLRIGALFHPPQHSLGSNWRQPATTAERTLRELWSLALGTDAEKISASDSFLKRGDSIQAMRLVGMARQQSLLLTVADIFQYPILEDMAKLLKNMEDSKDEAKQPFTLLNSDVDIGKARQYVGSMCDVPADEIEDLFPTTQLQEGLLALTTKRGGDYTGRNVVELGPQVDIARFKAAWEKVIATIPILRTRIVDLPGQGCKELKSPISLGPFNYSFAYFSFPS
jgi:aryl carrier-like protein